MASEHQEAFLALGNIPGLAEATAATPLTESDTEHESAVPDLNQKDRYVKGFGIWRDAYPLASPIMTDMLTTISPLLLSCVRKKASKARDAGWDPEEFTGHGYNTAYMSAMRALATYNASRGTIVNYICVCAGSDLNNEIKLKANRRVRGTSLDAPVGDDGDRHGMVKDVTAVEPDELHQQHEMVSYLRVLLGIALPTKLLTDSETTVLTQRFNLLPPEHQTRPQGATLEEAGDAIGGKTREWARQLEARGLRKLRPYMTDPGRIVDVTQAYMKPGQALALLTYYEVLKQRPAEIVWAPHTLPNYLPPIVDALGKQLRLHAVVPRTLITPAMIAMRSTVGQRFNPSEIDMTRQLIALAPLANISLTDLAQDLGIPTSDLTRPKKFKPPKVISQRTQLNQQLASIAEGLKDLPPIPDHWFDGEKPPPDLAERYAALTHREQLIVSEFVSRAAGQQDTRVKAIHQAIIKRHNIKLGVDHMYTHLDHACESLGLESAREQFYSDHYKMSLVTMQRLKAIEKDYTTPPSQEGLLAGVSPEKFSTLAPLERVVVTWRVRHPKDTNEQLRDRINQTHSLGLSVHSIQHALKGARAHFDKQTDHGRQIASTLTQLSKVGELKLELPLNDDVTYADVERAKRLFRGDTDSVEDGEITLTTDASAETDTPALSKLGRMVYFVYESERAKKPHKKIKPDDVAALVEKRWGVATTGKSVQTMVPLVRRALGGETKLRVGYDVTREFNMQNLTLYASLPNQWERIITAVGAIPLDPIQAQEAFGKFSPSQRALTVAWVTLSQTGETPRTAIKFDEVNRWLRENDHKLSFPQAAVYNLGLTKIRKALRQQGT